MLYDEFIADRIKKNSQRIKYIDYRNENGEWPTVQNGRKDALRHTFR